MVSEKGTSQIDEIQSEWREEILAEIFTIHFCSLFS